jgi:hypothetical protein
VLLTVHGLDAGRASPALTTTSIGSVIKGMCERAVPQSTCRDATPEPFERIPAQFAATLEAGIGPRIVALLKQAPTADAFFVPPDNAAYWQFALGGMRPFENLNFLPAHFGRPLLLGLPPVEFELDPARVGAVLLGSYGETARSRELSDDELCRHARARAIARVVVFASLDAVRLLECR